MTHAPGRGPRMTAGQIRQYAFTPARRYRGGLDPDDVRRFQHDMASLVEGLENALKNAHRFPAAEVAKREATLIYRDGLRAKEGLVQEGQAMHRELVDDGYRCREAMIATARAEVDAIMAKAAAGWPEADRDAFRELMISMLGGVMQTLEQSRPNRVLAQADGSGAGQPRSGPV